MLALRLVQRLKRQQAKTPNAFTLVELLVVGDQRKMYHQVFKK